ncbi:MAG: acyl carrier protein [Bacteroidales bacterium]|nr:acyl carrier protein [Bacteroidales bacterium]
MDREEIIAKLTPLVREVFDNAQLEIVDTMGPDTVEGWTSLSFMQLLARIEGEFGFKFKIFELVGIHNMGDLVAAILKRLSDSNQ